MKHESIKRPPQQGRNRRITVERCLLGCIIALQSAILFMLWHRRAEPVIDASHTAQVGELSPYTRPGAANDPWQQARHMMEGMDALFENAVTKFERMETFFDLDNGWDATMTSPAMDLREQQDDYVVVFSLPTPRPSDLQVLLDGRVLTILTVFNQPALIHRYGEPLRFEKRVQMPGPVGDSALAAAHLTNGLLRVSVPKGAVTDSAYGFRRLM
jgi:HSP20 family molecular chaperone IbpA